MIKTMTAAAHVPHLGYCDEIQMDNLMALRARLKPVAEKRGVALSFLPFMLKAASLALHQYPLLNARLSPDGTELIHRGAHNIGFALASAEGLLVPNVKNVDQLSVFEIASELARIIEAGRTGRLPPSDLSGGSLTLSNIGTVGGTYTSPVLLAARGGDWRVWQNAAPAALRRQRQRGAGEHHERELVGRSPHRGRHDDRVVQQRLQGPAGGSGAQ
jgi:2-oxoisovalerate dehydrogenase E2 component (dihydrolipoyl transacylase)